MNHKIPHHALRAQEVLRMLNTTLTLGLSNSEVALRTRSYGANTLPSGTSPGIASLVFKQCRNPLILLLLISSAIAFSIGHATDGKMILAVVLFNGLIGTYQELRAQRSINALKSITPTFARVIRGGQEEQVNAQTLVPGDLMVLQAGDKIGADGRLLEVHSLYTTEAALTGESNLVFKQIEPIDAAALVADRTNMVHAGTHVAKGRAIAVVTAIGVNTELGKIATLAETASPPVTPLQKKIEDLSQKILKIACVVFVATMLLGQLRGFELAQLFMLALSMVVSMVPEGLPVAITIALAIGMQRMAKRRAIVRHLEAVETLAAATKICTDKTGTLTKNEMEVCSCLLLPNRRFDTNGTSLASDPDFRELLHAAALCNDAHLSGSGAEQPVASLGDPTEIALLAFAEKYGIFVEQLREVWDRQEEIPFDSNAKMMAVHVRKEENHLIYIKGAPESVLPLCNAFLRQGHSHPLNPDLLHAIKEYEEEMCAKGLRLLACAKITQGEISLTAGWEPLAGRGCFLGIIGEIDPPREGVVSAIEACGSAGVQTVMITGDHPITARAIGEAIHMVRAGDLVVEGRELAQLSDDQLVALLPRISIFARITPEQKLRIVSLEQSQGNVVIVTGDGVNDAPALMKADVGVAMGITGTEIAKEASKIVITDDRFTTLVDAIREGRIIFRNIRKLILYLTGTAMSALLILLSSLFLNLSIPLVPIQILWINFITDGVLSLPIILQPAEGDEMNTPPVAKEEPLINSSMQRRLYLMVPIMVGSLLFYVISHQDRPLIEMQSGVFLLLATCQWFNALNCRSSTRSAFHCLSRDIPMLSALAVTAILQCTILFVPWFHAPFHAAWIAPETLCEIGILGSLVLWAEEARKWWVRNRKQGTL